MNFIVLGGDGYLGWPTAMHLSSLGHNVMVVDNYLKRDLIKETEVKPLFEVPMLEERSKLWDKFSDNKIYVKEGDLTDLDFVKALFTDFLPDGIVHYAEQPSAPYSMMNSVAANKTLLNNLLVTHNVILAMSEVCPEAGLVKLGTMGEYGTPNIDIEEGWIEINHKGRKDKFLFPRQASSLYHTTKIMDTDLLWFYVRTWGLKVTDLMQGPVYGLKTNDTHVQDLQPAFFYDEIFGTVLNRFLVQAAINFPLTIYGNGSQQRGYINIIDTVNCIRLCLEQPPKKGEMRIFNQFVDQFDVNSLAEKVKTVGKQFSVNVQIKNIKNPRIEREDHYYNPASTGLRDLGLSPHPLTDELLAEMFEEVLKHKDNILDKQIFTGIKWTK